MALGNVSIGLLFFPVTRVDSFKVPQAPQAGHFPLHLLVSKPQSVQKKIVAIKSTSNFVPQ
jgi:hypothetical protein